MNGPTPPNVVLIGYRGCGKTTVGRLLASWLGWRFVDTDVLVEARAGTTVAELFATQGEDEFRRLETEIIAELAKKARQVLSAGGGAVTIAENVARLRAAGTVVWLTAPPEVLWERIREDACSSRTRPNLTAAGGLDEVRRVLAERESIYRSAADIVIATADRTPDEVVAAVIDAIPGCDTQL